MGMGMTTSPNPLQVSYQSNESMISSTHLHAMLVHFPIALLLVGFFSEIITLFSARAFFRQAALYLLILGAAGVIAAFFSGDAAGAGMEEGSIGKALARHEQAAEVTLWLAIAAVTLRAATTILNWGQTWLKITAFVLFTFSAIAVARTGSLGGQLVFQHAAGVELSID